MALKHVKKIKGATHKNGDVTARVNNTALSAKCIAPNNFFGREGGGVTQEYCPKANSQGKTMKKNLVRVFT